MRRSSRVGVLAIVVLVSTAVVIGASRQAPDRAAGLIAVASPSPRPSATPSMTPAPTPSVTPVPATPTPVATPVAATATPEPSPETDVCCDTDPVEDYYENDEPEPMVSLMIGGIDGEAPLYIRTGDAVESVLELGTYERR